MTKTRWLAAASALSLLTLAACQVRVGRQQCRRCRRSGDRGGGRRPRQARPDRDERRHLLPHRRGARGGQSADPGRRLHERNLQAPDDPGLRPAARRRRGQERQRLLAKFDAFYGPWDPIEDKAPFFGGKPKPAGAGFYPADLTKEEFDTYLAANPGRARGADQPLYGGQAQGRQARRRALQPGI